MNKRRRNRIISLFTLLFFIAGQALLLYHPHEEAENENCSSHATGKQHIHSTTIEQCVLCHPGFHSPFYINQLLPSIRKEKQKTILIKIQAWIAHEIVDRHSRGPPMQST